MELLVGPFASALVGAGFALVGGYFAVRTELAVLSTKLVAVHERLDMMASEVREAHARIDRVVGNGK